MASIKCGACKGTHDSIERVRACYDDIKIIEEMVLKSGLRIANPQLIDDTEIIEEMVLKSGLRIADKQLIEDTEVIEDTGLKCLNRNASTPCQGEVYERPSLTRTGKWIARCDFHYDLRVQEEDKRTRAGVYDVDPPEWFDPAAAGETW